MKKLRSIDRTYLFKLLNPIFSDFIEVDLVLRIGARYYVINLCEHF
jgi:hypothetical protein